MESENRWFVTYKSSLFSSQEEIEKNRQLLRQATGHEVSVTDDNGRIKFNILPQEAQLEVKKDT